MRVADNMTYDQVRHNVSKNRSEMSDLQNQAATQKRVTKPSDDPVAAARVLGRRVDLRGNEQYQKNLNYAESFLNFTDQSLGELTESLNRIKELAIGQASDASANPQSRRVVATEVEQVLGQMIAIGNRKLGDRYIFGGFKTTERPFAPTGNYRGDENEIMIHVDKDAYIAMNIPGSKVFLGAGLTADNISHAEQTQSLLSTEGLEEYNQEQEAQKNEPTVVRGPATDDDGDPHTGRPRENSGGINILNVVKHLHTALQANDKVGIQELLEDIDNAVEQVVLARAQAGSRASVLRGAMESLHSENVDTNAQISHLEDADVFKVVSDINKTESSLQATLQTSGKILPKSLLDFVR